MNYEAIMRDIHYITLLWAKDTWKQQVPLKASSLEPNLKEDRMWVHLKKIYFINNVLGNTIKFEAHYKLYLPMETQMPIFSLNKKKSS